jgi:adenosylmethionine-8-amino-7-oxononanoate aminotransferase
MTGSLTGLELFHKKFDLPLSQVLHTEAPYYFRRETSRCRRRISLPIAQANSKP